MRKHIKVLLLLLIIIPIHINADVVDIDSKNALMINLNNNEIIYEKEKDEVINIASMQKIMTTLVAIEHIDDLDESFVLPSGIFDNLDPNLAVVGFYPGETVTYKDLLYGTMLKSGGDAAYALAIMVSGSEEEFVKLMNDKIKELELKNTVYKNTTGLDADGQHSTVYDMAIILKYAINNKKFKEIISTPEYTTTDGSYSFKGPVNKAKSLGLDYFIGGKTGYTSLAGLCLASFSSYDDINYLLVTAGANEDKDNQNFYDQKLVYNYFIENYSFKTIITKNKKIKTIKTMYDEDVVLKASKDVEKYIEKNVSKKDIKYIYKGKEVLDRNIKKGDKIGKLQIIYKDKVLYEENIVSPITVKFKLKIQYKIALIIILSSMFIHLFFRSIRRKRKRKCYN